MANIDILKKLRLYKTNPDLVQEMKPNEIADIAILVLSQVNEIEKQIKSGNDFATRELTSSINKAIQDHRAENNALNNAIKTATSSKEAEIDSKLSQIDTEVANALASLQKRVESLQDGVVTEAEVERAAQIALSMLELPDFEQMVSTAIQSDGEAIRNALELLQGDARYKVEIADVQGLTDTLNQLAQISGAQGGTIGKQQVYGFIRQAVVDGIITTGSGSVSDEAYGGTWDGVTDEAPSKNAIYDKIEALVLGSGTGDVVGPVASVTNRIAAFDGITGKLLKDGGKTIAEVLSTDNHTDGTTNKVFTATEKTKLGGIEASADVTDTANVTSAGALMDSEVTNLAAVKSFDPSAYAPALGANDNYVTDAEKVVIGNTSGTNSGDNAVNSNYSGLVTNATHTGDVTGATALTIANKAVTLAKMDDMATASLIYRKTAGTGAPEVNSLATLKTDLGLTGTNSGDQTLPTRDSLGLDTDDSPQFTGIELGHASDTTLTRVSAGVASIEGNNIITANITSSDTVSGVVELATTAETNTGTDAGRAVTPDALAGSYAGTKSLSVQVYDGATDVATGDGKAYITIPDSLNGMNLVRAQATVVTAGTTNATTVMIYNKTDSQDMLSGAISIASAGTVGTVGTVNGSYDDVATNDVIRIDVDSVSTTAPKGLMVVLEFRLP